MELDLNHVHVAIRKPKQVNDQGFDTVVEAGALLISKELKGNVLVNGATPLQINQLLDLIERKKVKKLERITFKVKDQFRVSEFLKDQFKIIKAAGGVVKKGDKILMIYRLKKWDLPKGKIEKGEKTKEAAKREVEEECRIKVDRKDRICKTWHTYTLHKKRVLKKTTWYNFDIVDDSEMAPQTEEHIEKVEWKTKDEVLDCLKDSYTTIHKVIKTYYNL